MTMRLQVEAGSSCQAASAALFPLTMRAPQLAPPPPRQDDVLPAARADHRLEVPLAELSFRHLRTAEEIASIVQLRREIQLVAAGVADPAFVAREKKETRRALSPLSNAAATTSGRSASFR